MEDRTKFSFYTCRYNQDLEMPIIIITCSSKSISRRYISEYFLFIPKTNYFIGLSMAAIEYKLLDFNIDFDYMINRAINVCQAEIYKYISEINQDKNNLNYLHYDVELREDDPIKFMNLIKDGKFKKQIDSVRNNTKCIELKNFIDRIIDSEESFEIKYKEIL